MSALEVYGEQYDPATHSWPKGVRPTGPVCGRCKGSGELHVNQQREPETGVWTSDDIDCPSCYGTGVRPPASFAGAR